MGANLGKSGFKGFGNFVICFWKYGPKIDEQSVVCGVANEC
jgi:hypothetical protein